MFFLHFYLTTIDCIEVDYGDSNEQILLLFHYQLWVHIPWTLRRIDWQCWNAAKQSSKNGRKVVAYKAGQRVVNPSLFSGEYNATTASSSSRPKKIQGLKNRDQFSFGFKSFRFSCLFPYDPDKRLYLKFFKRYGPLLIVVKSFYQICLKSIQWFFHIFI